MALDISIVTNLIAQIGNYIGGGLSAGAGVLTAAYAQFGLKPKFSRNRKARSAEFRKHKNLKKKLFIVAGALVLLAAPINTIYNDFMAGGGLDQDPSTPWSLDLGQIRTQTTFASVTSGTDEIEHSVGKNYEFIITSSDLNSANDTVWTVTGTTRRIDNLVSWDGTDADVVISYSCKAFSFRDQVDTSDSTDYYTTDYDSSAYFNVTVDGVAYKNLPANDVVTHATDGSWVVSATLSDYTTADKCVKNNFNKCKMLECVVRPTGDLFILNYMKN